jgi:outer membrane biosynthesis protein TonB
MKWALIGVLTLGALGAWAMGLHAAGGLSGEWKPPPVPKVMMRKLPPLTGAPVAVATRGAPTSPPKPEHQAPKPEAAPPKPEPVAAEPAPPPALVPEPEAAKPEPVKPEPVKPEPVKPEPVKPEQVKPEQVKPEQVKPDPARPAERVAMAKEPREPKEPKEPAQPREPSSAPVAGEGFVNLRASDTAEIVIDGRKIGPSPRLGYKLKAGKHKIRFDCYDDNGNLKPGKVQSVEVKPDEEHDVSYDCPFSQ